MTKSDKFYVRNPETGAGVIFNSEKEARDWVKADPRYVLESDDERESNQRAADEEVAAKAAEASEDKAVRPAQNKSRG